MKTDLQDKNPLEGWRNFVKSLSRAYLHPKKEEPLEEKI